MKKAILQVLYVMHKQYKQTGPAGKQELEILADTLRQLFGEWVADVWNNLS